jgi:hypothetical protein
MLQQQQTENKKTFRPYLSNLVWSFYGFVAIVLAYRFLFLRDKTGAFFICLVACCFFIVFHWRRFKSRTHGVRLEKRAVADLRKVLNRINGATLEAGVMLYTGGDADAVVVLNGVKFNIEIKSVQSAQKITDKHITQVRRASILLNSVPVIWLPGGKDNYARDKNDTRIFIGDAGGLVKFLNDI